MEKKITVQYYANTKLKPKSAVVNGRPVFVFPLYIRVIYDASNTQFKADLWENTLFVTEDLSQLNSPEIKAATKKYAAKIESTLKAEIAKFGKEFELSGIGKRMKYYEYSIVDILRLTTLFRLESHLRYIGFKANLWEEYEKTLKLIFDLMERVDKVDITVYDWLLDDGIEAFKEDSAARGFEDPHIGFAKEIIGDLIDIYVVA